MSAPGLAVGATARPVPDVATRGTRRRRRLRFRVILAFTLGSLVISATIAVATYALCERYLVEQRERALLRQAWSDAQLVKQVLRTPDPRAAIEGIDPGVDARMLVRRGDSWYAAGVGIGRGRLPTSVRGAVAAGEAVHQRIRVDGAPLFVVGVPLPAVGGEFYEVTTLDVLDRTLRTIAFALVAGGALATALGALLAVLVVRVVLRPLSDTAAAAARVADGDFDTRLVEDDDPDLAVLSKSFNRMVDAVQHRLRREASFSSDVSHELRSPITTLNAATELMARRRDQMPADVQEIFDLLRADITRFSQLVEDLLEISRADANAEELHLEPVVLAEFVERSIARAGCATPEIDIVSDSARDPVLVDKRRLARVVENLALNAAAYAGGLTTVRVARHAGSAILEFEDSGPGVDPAERSLVFERFHRGAAAGSRGSTKGSGLGLALVSEQVRLHGGHVSVVDGRAGRGACFIVELPWRTS